MNLRTRNAAQQNARWRLLPPWAVKLTLLVLILALLASQSSLLENWPSLSSLDMNRMASALQRLQQFTSAWSKPAAVMPRNPAYTRVRVQTQEDFERLYPLVLRYSQRPEEAASVTEFVFQAEFKQERYFLCPNMSRVDEFKLREDQRSVSEEDPAIINAVDHLDLEGDVKQDWIRVLTWMKPEYREERHAFKSEDIGFELEPYFRSRDSLFAHYAAAILLMLCPNIERLVYEDNFYYGPKNTVFDTLCRNNYELLPQKHLQKLRHVHVIPTSNIILGDDRFYTKMNFLGLLRMFHRLPSIESVSIDAIQPDDAGDDESLFPPGTANFDTMKIGHSMMPSSMIAALVRTPKELREFSFSTGGRASLGRAFYIVYPKTIGKALYCHKDSLRKLDLDLDEHLGFSDPDRGRIQDEDHPGDDGDEELEWDTHAFTDQDKDEMRSPLYTAELSDTRNFGATMGSFHDFTSLTHLSIGIQLLLGPRPQMKMYGRSSHATAPCRLIDSLPRSLEYLLIRGYTKGQDEHFDDQIQEFLALRRERMPNLQVIEGLEECVPSGESVDRPDDHPDLLWQKPVVENEWLEAGSI